jgi:protein-S-isoprenylcysteine O-methyltransferase Ste14
MISANGVILLSWALFLLVWLGLSFFVKRDVRGGRSARVYQLRVLILAIVIIVIRSSRRHHAGANLFSNRLALFVPTPPLLWIGAALTAIGISLAIWARLYIGRNWSPRPAKKEEHELVTGGPYAFVRHPIYTGIIVAALGTALTGTIFGAILFIAAAALFVSRVGKEERIMLELFPGAYPSYQSRTKRLIPFVW